jgi:hypothetical protein
VAAFICAFVVAAVTVAGVRTATSHDAKALASPGNRGGVGPGSVGPGNVGPGSVGPGGVFSGVGSRTVGTLTSINGPVLTLLTDTGASPTVEVSSTLMQASSLGAVLVGDTLRDTGSPATNGDVLATSIEVGVQVANTTGR